MSGELTVGSLFSGIGGLELGLERTGGFRTLWQCEIDPYCRAVLRKHWPDTHCYEDIRDIAGEAEPVDVICGGFPCQPVSQAAARSERSEGWMWPEMLRIVTLLRPSWVVIENPEALRYARRGLAHVLRDLAGVGFDAEWRVVRASDVGAPHKRARLWVVANAHSNSKPAFSINDEASILPQLEPAHREWPPVPSVRMDDGLPGGVQRLRALGNSVVPQVAQFVGEMILAAA